MTANELVPSALDVGKQSEVRDGLFYCQVTYAVAAPPDKVLAAFQGDWELWWRSGRRLDVRVNDRGVTSWKFLPIRFLGAFLRFDMVVQPPRIETNAAGRPEKIVMSFTIEGFCNGPGSYEIYAAPDGGSFVRGIWNGVRPGLRREPPAIMGYIHMVTERRAMANLARLLA